MPNDSEYDPTVHLNPEDIKWIIHPTRQLSKYILRHPKQTNSVKGLICTWGRQAYHYALLLQFVVRGTGPGPFRFGDGRYSTRSRFVDSMRSALQQTGIDQSLYCSHSFQIGAATTAAAKRIEDSLIQTLGRWQSSAYLRYVKLLRSQLARISCVLASP